MSPLNGMPTTSEKSETPDPPGTNRSTGRADSAAVTPAPPGWYGKLPALGDFASRRLPPDFVLACDAWLLQGLSRCSETFGPRWWERYRVAPVVRFWLPAGRTGDAVARAGLVMPSMDRVGRHFPLMLAAPAPSRRRALRAAAWFDALENAARSVLDLRRDVDDFEAALHALPPSPGAAGTHDADREDDDDHDDHDDHDDDAAMAGFGIEDPRTDSLDRSAWWCEGGRPQRFRGWPPPDAFVRVLAALSTEEETLP